MIIINLSSTFLKKIDFFQLFFRFFSIFFIENKTMTSFLKNLETLLNQKSGITQKDICIAANLDKSAYNMWKKGSLPKVDAAFKIAQFLGTSVEFLMTGEDPQGITSDEIQLVCKWRLIGAESRRTALLIIDDAYEKAVAAQKEKKGTA